MKVCVLMATYNGKQYIVEQLESIFGQKREDFDLQVVIRDDGSKDGTTNLCEEYAQKNNVDISIVRGKNIGPARSFLELIHICPEADYYAFCDQDDVWIQGKLRKAILTLEDDICKPSLWFSNYKVVDKNLNVLHENSIKEPLLDPIKLLFYNNVPGCTMVFNKRLLDEMRRVNVREFRMHDIYALDIATLVGEVHYEPMSYILYRQHDNNALGYGNKKISITKWFQKKIEYLKCVDSYHMSEYAERILEVYSDELSKGQKQAFMLLSKYKQSRLLTFQLLLKPYTRNGINRTSISIRMKVLLHRF